MWNKNLFDVDITAKLFSNVEEFLFCNLAVMPYVWKFETMNIGLWLSR